MTNEKTTEGMAFVPAETAAKSEEKKRQRRTLAQLQVYRDTMNLEYLATLMLRSAPKRLTKFFDVLLVTIDETAKSIGLADVSRDGETRGWYQDMTRIMAQDVLAKFDILHKLGVMSTDEWKKTKALAKGVVAQLIAWRDYTRNQGVNSRTETNNVKL